MTLNDRSNLHFLRIAENLTAANMQAKHPVWDGANSYRRFMKIDKNWRIA
jgi:hypothetical protein